MASIIAGLDAGTSRNWLRFVDCRRWETRDLGQHPGNPEMRSMSHHRPKTRDVARTPSAEYLILDIETIPDTDRWSRPETGDAPFPPTWAHRIVVVGCLWLDHHYQLKRFGVIGEQEPGAGPPDTRERQLLEEFSRFLGRARPVLVTYNGRSFDLPVIVMRSLCHAISLPWYYRDRDVRYRYSAEGHLDLCDWLADHGAARPGKLDAVARLIGLPGKIGVDGSQVEGLYHSGQLDSIQRYCLADVSQTALLFLRFRLLQGQLAPEAYRERTTALLEALAADGRVAEVLDQARRDQLLGLPPLIPDA
jgi:predicted PolB exonuclease-like 3'-5' exonuclease